MAPASFQPNRIGAGGLIDRTRTLSFTFDGEELAGHPGDTLASALLANGVRLVGRSFKYHRPRGILTAWLGGAECAGRAAASGARREPNTRATTIELYDGLDATSQNRWPSLKFDLLAVNQLFAPIFGAGFYYKTFMWPASFWEKVYEPAIRRAAGLAAPPTRRRPRPLREGERLLRRARHRRRVRRACSGTGCRAVRRAGDPVRGGFPSRRPAARRALRDRRRVPRSNGSRRPRPSSKACPIAASCGGPRCSASMTAAPMPRSSASTTTCRCRPSTSRASGCGASWRSAPCLPPAPSSGRSCSATTTGPASCLPAPCAAYVNRFGVAPGGRAVVFAGNDDAFRTALDLADAGVEVAAIVDAQAWRLAMPRKAAEHAQGALSRGAAIHARARAPSRQGRRDQAMRAAKTERIDCDSIAMSGGWNPTIHLTTHLNGKPVWSEELSALVARASFRRA